MTDWDAIFGEAALGLDLAKVDHASDGLDRRNGRSPGQALLDPRRDPGARPLQLHDGGPRSPEASASASHSPGLSPTGPRSCCSTRRPANWTP